MAQPINTVKETFVPSKHLQKVFEGDPIIYKGDLMKYGGNGYFLLIMNPFGNCQNFALSFVNYFFLGQLNGEYLLPTLEYAYGISHKRCVVMDLNYQFVKKVKDIVGLKYDVMFEQPYDSTNGSSMVFIMFKRK